MNIKSIKSKRLISVITCTFNAEKEILATLDSLRGQTYENIEFIVIDGASNDRTTRILSENQDIISFWESEPDQGIYDAWNKALEKIHGDWVVFLGAGDQLPKDWPWKINSASLDNDLLYGDIEMKISSHQHSLPIARLYGLPWEKAKKKLDVKMTLLHPGMAHNVRIFKKHKFDETLKIVGDWEILTRYPVKKAIYFPGTLQSKMVMGGVSASVHTMERHYREWSGVLKQKNKQPPGFSVLIWKIKIFITKYPALFFLLQKINWKLRSLLK